MGRVGQPVLQDKSENGSKLGIFLGVGGGWDRRQGQGQEAGTGTGGRDGEFYVNYLAVETVGF
jgi:hypothetical protein